MRKLFLILFYGFARFLPKSTTPGIGRIAKKIRSRICRHLFNGSCGKLNVECGAYFGNGKNFTLGDNVGLGKNFSSHNRVVTVDGELMMGEEVMFIGGAHAFDRTDIPMGQQGGTTNIPLHICEDVWIGTRAMILPGCKRIGKGAIIGAGSIVTHDVPDWAVVGGNPARVIKMRK